MVSSPIRYQRGRADDEDAPGAGRVKRRVDAGCH